MTAMRLKRYPSPSGGFALGKMGVGATMLKQGKTARDYVQDGLVAMWDGIENAGWGTHDPSATRSTELVTGAQNNFPSSVNGAISATPDAYRMTAIGSGSFTFNVSSPAATANSTIESVWRIVSMPSAPTANCYVVQFLGGYARIPLITRSGAQTAYWGGIGQPDLNISAVGGTSRISASWTADANNGTVCYKYGDVLRTYTSYNAPTGGATAFFYSPSTTSWPQGTVIDLHSVRIYNRALTADEIAANYAIDKERFNLP